MVRLRLGQQNLVSLEGRDCAGENDFNLSQCFEELLGLDSSKSDGIVFEEKIVDGIIYCETQLQQEF